MLEILVPEVEINGIARGCGLAPQFPSGEPDGGKMLRLVSLIVRLRLGKEIDGTVAGDRAVLPARVARQPRVAGRVDVALSDALSRFEVRRRLRIAPSRRTTIRRLGGSLGRQAQF